MTRFSEKLNKIKYEYILSTKRAKEAEQNKVAVRSRESGDIGTMEMEEFKKKI